MSEHLGQPYVLSPAERIWDAEMEIHCIVHALLGGTPHMPGETISVSYRNSSGGLMRLLLGETWDGDSHNFLPYVEAEVSDPDTREAIGGESVQLLHDDTAVLTSGPVKTTKNATEVMAKRAELMVQKLQINGRDLDLQVDTSYLAREAA